MRADDIATALEEAAREEAIEHERASNPLPYIGHCYACHAELQGGMRFCGAECRDDHEFFVAAKKRNHGFF